MNFDKFLEAVDKRIKDKFDDLIWRWSNERFRVCEGCGCFVHIEHGEKVKRYGPFGVSISEFYCKRCKPPYDEFIDASNGHKILGYTKPTYLKNRVEVNEKGKPV